MDQTRQHTSLTPMFIEIVHSRTEPNDIPPVLTAHETIMQLEADGQFEAVDSIVAAADEVNKIVRISRAEGEETRYLADIFTADQIIEMQRRIHNYLGTNIDSHLASSTMPKGFASYVGRLATYFMASEDLVTSQFGEFERRHSDPSANARGPYEKNSREYAVWANSLLLRQLDEFYQTDLKIELVGPTKEVENSRISWEKGIAESQFIVLDYVRDIITSNNSASTGSEVETMTVQDIESNILNLLTSRKQILTELMSINPLLAQQTDQTIESLLYFTQEVFHRGKIGTPRFKKEPANARRAIYRIEQLLTQANALAGTKENQAEIPIIDI